MKLSERLNELLNTQVTHELRNSNIYLQLASFCEDFQLKNLASYFYKLSEEEKGHANKFIKHINDRTGGKVAIQEIPSPSLSLETFEDVAKAYVVTEELTTEKIEEIMQIVRQESSFIDEPFILDMLAEQVSDEDEAAEFFTKISMVGDIVIFDATFKG